MQGPGVGHEFLNFDELCLVYEHYHFIRGYHIGIAKWLFCMKKLTFILLFIIIFIPSLSYAGCDDPLGDE